jgi:hypothetical protein
MTLRTAEHFGDGANVKQFGGRSDVNDLSFDLCRATTSNGDGIGGSVRRRENNAHNRNSVKVSLIGEHNACPTFGVDYIQEQATDGATKNGPTGLPWTVEDFFRATKAQRCAG